ncbi:hypothetical protein RGU72_04860 [Undibacterium sp. 5I1]|uniref:hypothetical protein n=1 Tax=unclassified Undibacterium TaxID=2630295 RepID=UPI002AB50807|nr:MULTISPECIES: hypothetical protein [unclassified Undibacterium]MDY7537583.1 hypothetical protein [Undibacterium sp. 5I1]MEB0231968.1 hypothetical protein [Undibacterium sp. 10I3]MEB0256319.1 hypothetical protein [Undibacterium sp. 5I1]
MNQHPKQHLYPIIDSEFGTRFFDQDLIYAIQECDDDSFADPIVRQRCEDAGLKPMVWSEMSLHDQVMAQIGFVAPPPRRDVSPKEEHVREEAWATKVIASINALGE